MNSDFQRLPQVLFTIPGADTSDGAGVNLKRIIGQPRLRELDPFILLDEFKSDDPEDYSAGFPEHPHRGFSTLTYLKYGQFKHRDSMNNEGHLHEGSLQWMTAGRGIRHSEMPMMENGLLWGYQLWINLPASQKMMEPFYKDIPAKDVPVITSESSQIKVLAGNYKDTNSAVPEVYPFIYLDIELNSNTETEIPLNNEDSILVYLYKGSIIGIFDGSEKEIHAENGVLIRLQNIDNKITLKSGAFKSDSASQSGDTKTGLLFLAAKSIGEPISRGGPFVMNTDAEIRQAYMELG
jgi:quercetin 2,3-dioxygenase